MPSPFDILFGDSPIDQALATALGPVMQKIGGGDPNQRVTSPPPPPKPAPSKEPMTSEDALPLIEKYESGGKNILQQIVDPKISTASGYYQITNSTWRGIAPRAGIDLKKYPTAMSAPRDLQATAATQLYNERGFSPWAPYNKRLASAIGYSGGVAASNTAAPSSGHSNTVAEQPDTSDVINEAKKTAPYGLVVLGADGSLLNYKGEKLPNQPKVATPKTPATPQSYTDFYKSIGGPEIDAAKKVQDESDAQRFGTAVMGAFANADTRNPNNAISRQERDRKAYDLVLSGQVPNLDVARTLLGNASAAQLAPVDPVKEKANSDALQNRTLKSLGDAIPGPPGLMFNLASQSEVAKTAVTMGLDAANMFNAAETVAPKTYAALKSVMTPQSGVGKTMAEYGGGAVKALAELGLLHHMMAPGMEDVGMDEAQAGGTVFGTQHLLTGASDVIAGKQSAQDVLQGLPAATAMGATFGEATNAFKESALATLENTPAALQNLGARVGAGAGAAAISTAFGGNTDDALNLGIFAALSEKPGDELRARQVEKQAAKVQDAVRDFSEKSGLDLSNIAPVSDPTISDADVRTSAEGEHTKLADLPDNKVLVETKDETGALTNQEMNADAFDALPKPGAEEAPAIEPPHTAATPGKFVTSEPLVDEPYVKKSDEYKGKTRPGVWVDDPDGKIGAAVIGDKGVLSRDGKTFIPEKNIERPEGFSEPKTEKPDGTTTRRNKPRNSVAQRGADDERVPADGTDGEQQPAAIEGARSENSAGSSGDESRSAQTTAEGTGDRAGGGSVGTDEGLGVDETTAIEQAKNAKELAKKGIPKFNDSIEKRFSEEEKAHLRSTRDAFPKHDYVKEVRNMSVKSADELVSKMPKPGEVGYVPPGTHTADQWESVIQDRKSIQEKGEHNNAITGRVESANDVAEHQGDDGLVESVGQDRKLVGQRSEEGAGNSQSSGLDEISRQSVLEDLKNKGIYDGTPQIKTLRDYAIQNRIPTTDAEGKNLNWKHLLENIRQDAFAKAAQKTEAKPPPSELATSGTLSAEIFPGVKALGERVANVVTKDIKPAVTHIVEGIGEAAHSAKAAIIPGSVGEGKQVSPVLREQLGISALSMSRADAAFGDAQKLFSKFTTEQQDKFTAAIESGEPTGDNNLDKIKDAVRGLLDADREMIRKVSPNALKDFDENYFPHLWKDPKRAERFIKATADAREAPELRGVNAMMDSMSASAQRAFLRKAESGEKFEDPKFEKFAEDIRAYVKDKPDIGIGALLGRRPFAGKKGFLKERTYATFQAGLDANLEPLTHNPVEAMLLHHGQVQKYLAAQNTMRELRSIKGMLVYTRGDAQPPPGYTRINDAIGKVFYKDKEGNLVHGGNWNMPEDGARVLNNYLSPGLWDKKWYASLRSMGNAMNQFQLSLSAFHAHFASLDAITSQVALSFKQLANGDFAKAGKSFITAPAAPFTDYGAAKKIKEELLKPGTHPELSELAKAFQMSGLRLSMDPAYRTNMRQKLQEVWKEPNSLLRSVLRVPGAAVEAAMSPILEKLVPNLKIGAFAQAAQYELERLGPDATHEQKRLAYQKIGESIENRLGQIAYDNLHWNRTMKDIFMISTRSVGWNFGSLREGIGGISDWGKFITKSGGKREFTDRMAYTIALPITTGIYGALLQGVMTGITGGTPQLPSTESLGAFVKDLYYPQTGQTDEEGRPKRVALPSYMKDVAHFTQGVMDRNPREIVNMATSKLHPFWGWIAETMNNRDFYNTQIWNGDDNAGKIGADILSHFSTAFVPFSVRGYMKSSQLDEPIANRLLQTAGLPPAPASLNETPAERKMYEYIHARLPQGVQTSEQTARHTTMNLIERQIRLGNKDFAEGMKSKALLENKISRNDIQKIDRRAQTDKKVADFKMLDPMESLNVMEKSNTEEYPKFYKELQAKGANLKEDRFTPDEWGDLRERFSKYGISIGGGSSRRGSGASGFGKGFGGGFKKGF